MTSSIQARYESPYELAKQLEREGYKVVLDPDIEDLPFDMGGYRPDLLATRGEGGIIFEVKSTVQADRLPVERLKSVAEIVRRHPWWRFLLMTSQDIPDDDLLVNPGAQDTWDSIRQRVIDADHLADKKDWETAYVILWIAFERMLRLQALRINLPIERLSPSIVIRQLYSLGELTMEQYDTALDCQRTRNQVVHGFRSTDIINIFERLNKLVKALWAEWATSPSMI